MHETRQKIIEYLKEKKAATVDELAAVVSLTPMAVRYHLNVLQGEGLIHTSDARRPNAGRGRPQQVYQLSEAADELFPVDYYSLTGYLLDELNVRLGKEEVNKLFSQIANRLVQEAPTLPKSQSFEERLNEVVKFLTGKGFVIDWERVDDNYLIHAYSCPYRQLAKVHKQVCLLDKSIITSMLNSDPTRVACLFNGDSHCTYQISAPVELIISA